MDTLHTTTPNSAFLQSIYDLEKQQDKELDRTQTHLNVIHNQAKDTNRELDEQQELIEAISMNVNDSNSRLERLNYKIKNFLKRPCCDWKYQILFLLFVILILLIILIVYS